MKTFRTSICSFLVLSALVLAAFSPAFAASVVLSWDPSPSPNVVGYKVYLGTSSRQYEYSIDVGNTLSTTLGDLPEGVTIYAAATAYDASGNESPYSEELVFQVPGSPPIIPAAPSQPASADSNAAAEPGVTPASYAPTGSAAAEAEQVPLSIPAQDEELSETPMEIGTVGVDDFGTYLPFAADFKDPVMVAFPQTRRENEPFTVRIDALDPSGARLRIMEEAGDGVHAEETVAYLAAEAGHHVLSGGFHVDAGQVRIKPRTQFRFVAFYRPFPLTPVVLIQDRNPEGHPVVPVQVAAVGPDGFWVSVSAGAPQDEARSRTLHLDYIAVQQGALQADRSFIQAGFVGAAVDGGLTRVQYQELASKAGILWFGARQVFDGWASKEVILQKAAAGVLDVGVRTTSRTSAAQPASTPQALVGILAVQWW